MLGEGTHEGPIAPRPPQSHGRVRAGFAGAPCPLSPLSPACACPPAWLLARPRRRSKSASPHSRVRSLFTGTSNIYPKCRALAGTPGPPALGSAAHPSSPLSHLLLFIYSLRVFPAVNHCWKHRAGGDGIQLPTGILAVTCRSISPSPYRGWIHPTNRENNGALWRLFPWIREL